LFFQIFLIVRKIEIHVTCASQGRGNGLGAAACLFGSSISKFT